MNEPPKTIRLDKWLWHARFFKTRSLASQVVAAGHVRVNSKKVTKPACAVVPDDTLTFSQAQIVRVVRILALSTRRGPAPEAQALYLDLTPEREIRPPAPKTAGKGRPTKKDRRDMRLSRDGPLE